LERGWGANGERVERGLAGRGRGREGIPRINRNIER